MISEEQLRELYIEQQQSSRQIAVAFGCSQRTVMVLLNKYGIERRSYKENKMPMEKGGSMSPEHRMAISRSLTARSDLRDSRRGYRLLAAGAFPNECFFCSSDVGLVVHHKSGDREDNRVRNLMILCASCHRKLHRSIEAYSDK